MSFVDFILLAGAAALVVLAVRTILRSAGSGECAGCSGDCTRCRGCEEKSEQR